MDSGRRAKSTPTSHVCLPWPAGSCLHHSSCFSFFVTRARVGFWPPPLGGARAAFRSFLASSCRCGPARWTYTSLLLLVESTPPFRLGVSLSFLRCLFSFALLWLYWEFMASHHTGCISASGKKGRKCLSFLLRARVRATIGFLIRSPKGACFLVVAFTAFPTDYLCQAPALTRC